MEKIKCQCRTWKWLNFKKNGHHPDCPLGGKKRPQKKEVRLGPEVFSSAGLPVPLPEYQVAHVFDKRGNPTYWRFDYAWESYKLFLEVQGGIWLARKGKHAGRHSGGKGQLGDMKKYTEAAIRGWRIIYATPQEVESLAVLGTIRRAIEATQIGWGRFTVDPREREPVEGTQKDQMR